MPGVDKIILQLVKTANGFNKSSLEKVRFVSASAGSCVAEFKVAEDHLNHMGGLHGGFSATMADIISSVALMTCQQSPTTSVCLNLNYLKPAMLGDEIIVDSQTVKKGKKIALIDVEIKNKVTGDLIVRGTHTKLVLE